eukprot:scaffold262092_cov27-Tisochrysis_lutea.AAC.2
MSKIVRGQERRRWGAFAATGWRLAGGRCFVRQANCASTGYHASAGHVGAHTIAQHRCSSRNWTSSRRRPGGGCAQTRSPTHDCANASTASAPGPRESPPA